MLPRLIAHLDFKGIQRTPSALLQYLETLAELGYDGLLVEYEDVFPFAGESFSMTLEGRWSRDFLAAFLAKAKSLGLKVIPLQQSLGHMEYMLRWERYHPYRLAQEATGEPIDSTTLHIKNESARAWLKGLLNEMIAAHPDSEYIHLAMDEAWPVSAYAYESKLDALTLFLEWLEELCDLCDAAGKKPLIWSDMLEEYINPGNIARLQALKDRVILVCWEYLSGAKPITEVRFGGWRVSWGWRACPRDLTPSVQVARYKPMEEWPPEIAALVGKYRVDDRHMEPLFQAAILKELGFRVMGCCAVMLKAEGAILPRYHRRMDNVDRWRGRVEEWQLDGLIVSAWARGGTCSSPTLIPEVHLPLMEYAAKGAVKRPVFDGVSPEALWHQLAKAGRSMESWSVMGSVISELESLEPSVNTHQEEWKTLILMARVFLHHSDAADYIALASASEYGNRWPELEWTLRIKACERVKAGFSALREEVFAHLSTRYEGSAFEEWIANVIDVPLKGLDAAAAAFVAYREESRKKFGIR